MLWFLVALDKLFQIDCLLSYILRALLVGFQAESVTAFVHIDGAETEAKNIILAGLTRALAIALTIDHLFVVVALLDYFNARLHAGAIMIYHSVRADWCANIALSDYKAGWALREPLFLAFLAALALFTLSVATPKGKWLLAAFIRLIKELGAGEVVRSCQVLFKLFVSCWLSLLSSSPLSTALALSAWLLLLLGLLLFAAWSAS